MPNTFSKLFFGLMLISGPYMAHAQVDTTKANEESLEDLLLVDQDEADVPAKKEYTIATFKTTRIATGQSIENVGKGLLDFRINHRFGSVDGGINQFFGLDNAVTRIGFDYGINDWLMVGIGRSTYNKETDGFVKVKLLRQTTDNRMPISLSYVASMSHQATQLVTPPAGASYPFSNRLGYVHQLLIARKFSDKFSLQLMPTLVHNNFVLYETVSNDEIAMGVGARYKIRPRMAITLEYYYLPGHDRLTGTYSSLTAGLDIETGGHVFQLFFSNSTGLTERSMITNTTQQWSKGQIHFGFNISRIFTVVRPKEFIGSRNKIM